MHKAEAANATLLVGLLLGWLVLIPGIFALLYTVIEMQSSARVAVGANTKLASYTISRIADRIVELEKNLGTNKPLLAKATEERKEVELAVLEAEQDSGAKVGSVTKFFFGNGLATATCSVLQECLQIVLVESSLRKSTLDPEIIKQVEAARQAMGSLQQLRSAQQTKKSREEQLTTLVAVDQGELINMVGGLGRPKGEQNVENSEDANSVALSYNKQRKIPFFESFFFLPPGVVIAFFTGLMGAIGAAIYSLFSQLNPKVDNGGGAKRPLLQAYVVRPLLGALAGFTVFFVASAGASFLIQPGGASATQAVNQLSPPALASLGIFSGLASERALGWLIEKAHAFFKTAPNARSPRGDGGQDA